MNRVAFKMLTGDGAKFAGIVLGLTFAALLITQQGSIFCGIMLRTSAQITDIIGADLWVMDVNVRSIDDAKPMIEDSLYRVHGVDGVRWAVPLYKGTARAELAFDDRETGQRREVIEQVILLGLDDVSLIGAPRHLYVGDIAGFWKPDAVMPDIERLLEGHTTVGNWSLGQICRHLATTLRVSVDMPASSPRDRSLLVDEERKREMLESGVLPEGVKTAPPFESPAQLDDRDEAEGLRQAIAHYWSSPGPVVAHPLFGMLSRDEWDRFHCHHCAHHRSFAVPR
jgi:Protein of unknown function (DUF1569)